MASSSATLLATLAFLVLTIAPASAQTVKLSFIRNVNVNQTFVMNFDALCKSNVTVGLSIRGGSLLVLSPDSYGAITVQAGGILKLRAGAYFATRLDVLANGFVYVDDSNGPVFLYLRDGFSNLGSIQRDPSQFVLAILGPPLLNLFVAVGGTPTRDTPTIVLSKPFQGSFVASKAVISFTNTTAGAYRGFFFGLRLGFGAGVPTFTNLAAPPTIITDNLIPDGTLPTSSQCFGFGPINPSTDGSVTRVVTTGYVPAATICTAPSLRMERAVITYQSTILRNFTTFLTFQVSFSLVIGGRTVVSTVLSNTDLTGAGAGSLFFGPDVVGGPLSGPIRFSNSLFSGKLNGKPLTRQPVSTLTTNGTLTFVNGTATAWRINPVVIPALKSLLQNMKAMADRCLSGIPVPASPPPPGCGVRRSLLSEDEVALEPLRGTGRHLLEGVVQSPNLAAEGACQFCVAACTAVSVAAGVGCAIATLGFGTAACIAGAVVAEVACISGCHFIGAPCCPVNCGHACCLKTQKCLNFDIGTCCPAGTDPCGKKRCCEPEKESCLDFVPGAPVCCPKGDRCGNKCCTPGTVCSDPTSGTCCKPGTGCGKTCCGDELDNCVNENTGLCCPFVQQACPSFAAIACCKTGQKCAGTTCVDIPQVCSPGVVQCTKDQDCTVALNTNYFCLGQCCEKIPA